jgi:hypothetical protein
MTKVRIVAAAADAARRLISPEYAETWDRATSDGWAAERIIRDLRADLRDEMKRNLDVRYMSTAGFTLMPVWDDGVVVGYDVLVSAGTIKP